ncbi:MAG: hypothetical protein ACOCZB_09240 [Spirochaetota bacterium]
MVEIQSSQAARSVQLTSILRAQYSSGKISLPVDGRVYARFKHVQGIPSQSSGGYSLNKLQMIDLIADRLIRLRGGHHQTPRPESEAEAGKLIESLARDLSEALHAVDTSRGSFASGLVESGLLFDLVA